MATDLTAGFDFAVHVSEDVLKEVFRSVFLRGILPSYVTYPSAEGTPGIDIFFGSPEVEVISHPSLSNPVRLTFPFLVRLDNCDDEFPGATSVVAPSEKVGTIDGNNQDTYEIKVNVGALADELFEFQIQSWPSMWQVSEGQLSWPPEFETLVKPAIINNIKASTDIELTPPAAPGASYFTYKTYMLTVTGFIGIFINDESSVEVAPPGQMASYLSQSDEMRIAVPAQTVHAAINDALKEMGLDPNPPHSGTVTIDEETHEFDELFIELRNGHLEVKGVVDSIEFWTTMGLKATDSGLETTVGTVHYDLPWYWDIVDFFSLGYISRVFGDELTKALGGLTTDAVRKTPFISTSIPGRDIYYKVHYMGTVQIRSDGIIVPANIELIYDAVPIEQPTYTIAHRVSKEFHRKGCFYGDQIGIGQQWRFFSEAVAIRQGYNGCWTCAREFSRPEGHLFFRFRSTGHAPHELVSWDNIEVKGEMLDGTFIIDDNKVSFPPFSTKKMTLEEGKADENGVWQQEFEVHYKLLGGLWQFQLEVGDMDPLPPATCKFRVKRSTKWVEGDDSITPGVNNYVSFTIGKTQGNFGYGEFPPFP